MQRRSKGASETLTYEIDFARALETNWQPGKEYSASQYVRPSTVNGFEYEATSAGQSDTEEPDWPVTITETVDDGTVEWTCRDFANNASDSIQTRLVTPDDGITVDGSSIQGTRIDVTVSGGTAGQTYDVHVTANTTAGSTFDEVLRITVTE